MKLLSLDLSLSCPGFAVLEIKDNKVSLLDVISVKTEDKKSRGERLAHIEFALTKFINKHKPFDKVIREDFQSSNGYTNKTIFSVWGISDLVLHRFGYTFDAEINAKTVKKTVTGKGNADKQEVEEGVRAYLQLKPTFTFRTSDESDACAIGLTYLFQQKWCTKEELIR